MSDFGSSRERALDKNADKLARKAKDRIAALADGIAKVTDFNPERLEDGDPDAMLRDYRRSAGSGLKKILAEAGAREAAAKAAENQK
jgi:hypothetical protein